MGIIDEINKGGYKSTYPPDPPLSWDDLKRIMSEVPRPEKQVRLYTNESGAEAFEIYASGDEERIKAYNTKMLAERIQRHISIRAAFVISHGIEEAEMLDWMFAYFDAKNEYPWSWVKKEWTIDEIDECKDSEDEDCSDYAMNTYYKIMYEHRRKEYTLHEIENAGYGDYTNLGVLSHEEVKNVILNYAKKNRVQEYAEVIKKRNETIKENATKKDK